MTLNLNQNIGIGRKVLESKSLNGKTAILELAEYTSDTLEPGAVYRLIRLIEHNGSLISQYPTNFQQQKKLEEVRKCFENISCANDFRSLENPEFETQEALRELVSLFQINS